MSTGSIVHTVLMQLTGVDSSVVAAAAIESFVADGQVIVNQLLAMWHADEPPVIINSLLRISSPSIERHHHVIDAWRHSASSSSSSREWCTDDLAT